MTSGFPRVLVVAAGLCGVFGPAVAEQVGITNEPAYVTKSDCQSLVRHNPSAGVAYQPGTDVHGRYVAPADLPGGSNLANLVPDKITFDLQVNPFGNRKAEQQQTSGVTRPLVGAHAPVAHVEVDVRTGQTLVNGQSLTGQQEQIVAEACRKAGGH